jgi:ADP-ribose diphosphatase
MAENRIIARHKWMALCAGYNDEPFVDVQPGLYVVPLNYAGEILFIREPAIHNGESVLSLPGGVVDSDESPAEAANRELQEEIGYKADVLFPIGVLNPLARHARWDIHLFLARNLMPSRKIGDEIYQIEVERVPFDQFEALITSGRLRDSNVIAALYLVRQFIGGRLIFDRTEKTP